MSNVVLEEEYDENYEPTDEEIFEYAKFLGMNPETEQHLLWIARESLKAPLPPNWKPCQAENNEVYYFNFKTGESLWEHPCDQYYKDLYLKEKQNDSKGNESSMKKSTSLNSIKSNKSSKKDVKESTNPPINTSTNPQSTIKRSDSNISDIILEDFEIDELLRDLPKSRNSSSKSLKEMPPGQKQEQVQIKNDIDFLTFEIPKSNSKVSEQKAEEPGRKAPSDTTQRDLFYKEKDEKKFYEDECRKIQDKYQLLLQEFQKHSFSDFLIKMEDTLKGLNLTKIQMLNDEYKEKAEEYKVDKELEYKSRINEMNSVWNERIQKYELDLKKEYENKCREKLVEFETGIEKDLVQRKEDIRKLHEDQILLLKAKNEEMIKKEEKLYENQLETFKQDMHQQFEFESKKIQMEYEQRFKEIEKDNKEKLKDFESSVDHLIQAREKYLEEEEKAQKAMLHQKFVDYETQLRESVENDTRALQSQMKHLEDRKKQLQLDEESVMKLEEEVKLLRQKLMTEKVTILEQVSHENQINGPFATFADNAQEQDTFNPKSNEVFVFPRTEAEVEIDHHLWREEEQIKAATEFFNNQNQSLAQVNQTFEKVKSQWKQSLDDIRQILIMNELEKQYQTPPPKPPTETKETQAGMIDESIQTAPQVKKQKPKKQVKVILHQLTKPTPKIDFEGEIARLGALVKEREGRTGYISISKANVGSGVIPRSLGKNSVTQYSSVAMLKEHSQWLNSFRARHADCLRT